MISANEVSIGNWLLIGKSVTPQMVLSIEFKRDTKPNYSINGYEISLFHGIPLTEDILLKCPNFEKHYDGNKEPFYSNKFLWRSEIYLNMYLYKNDKQGYNLHYGEDLIINVKALHHLQNVLYYLADQELTINL